MRARHPKARRATKARLAAVFAVAGLASMVLAPVADAVSAPTSGWWSRAATTTPTDELPAALPVPPPETPDTIPAGAAVPEGQLLVEGTAEGTTAIAAIRWVLDEGDSGASLTLPVAPGSTLNPQSIVLACKAATPWAKPDAGPGTWDTKPLVDGARCVNGVIADDLSSVAFGLQPLASGADLDIVVTPGKDPELESDGAPVDVSRSTFRWMFDAPSEDALRVIAGSGFTEGEGDRFIEPAPAPPPGFGAGGSSADGPPPVDVVISSPAFESSPDPVASPALEPQDLAPTVPDVRNTVPVSASSPGADRTIGIVLLLLAVAMAAWSYFTSDDDADGTIGLGRFARPRPEIAIAVEPTIGGLSRFAKPRSSPPTPLS